MKDGQPIVKISQNDFKNFKPLVLIVEDMNRDLIHKSLRIEADPKNKVYSCIFPDVNRLPNQFHYFELNNSLLTFNRHGFDIIYGKYSSVEDVFV